MSSFQRTNLHNAKKPSVNQSMESQILSMLKGVIMDENPMVDYSELEENIFDDNSYDSSQEEEEIPFRFNESDIDQTSFNKSSFFKREQTQKSQTTKATQAATTTQNSLSRSHQTKSLESKKKTTPPAKHK